MATTTCPKCGKLYEESSEERANEPGRQCNDCWRYQQAITGADPRAMQKLIEGLKHSQ